MNNKIPQHIYLIIFLIVSSFFSFQPMAAGLVENDRELRDDLAWLSDRKLINLNLTTWPLSQNAIEMALNKMSYTEDPVNRQVISRIYKKLLELKSPVSFSTYISTGRDRLPQTMSSERSAEQAFTVGINNTGVFWDLALKGHLEGTQWIPDTSHFNPNGSYAALLFANQWISFGEGMQWWGPGNDSSLIRSDAARPIAGFMMQRDEQKPFDSSWLSWLGSWQYQLMAGELRQYKHPEQPKLFGGRITFSPGNAIDLGFSRTIMWGGRGRPQNMDSFLDALLGRDNTGNQQKDPGNQLGGFDFRIPLALYMGIPGSLYGQVVGDDEAGFLPSHNTWLGGVEVHNIWGDKQINWYLEASDTRSQMKDTGIVYYHYCYQNGYYQQGWPLAGTVGGDGTLYSASLEIVLENNQRIKARGVVARVNRTSQSFNEAWPRSDTIKGVNMLWSLPYNDNLSFSPSAWVNHSHLDGNDIGIGMQLSVFSLQ